MNDDENAIRAVFGMPPNKEARLPHQGICDCGFQTASGLMKDLLAKGWKKNSFDHTDCRFALIRLTPAGLTVTTFDSFAAAQLEDKANEGSERPGKQAGARVAGNKRNYDQFQEVGK